MDCAICAYLAAEDIDSDGLQPTTTELSVETLETQLRCAVVQLIDLSHQALIGGKLDFELLEHCPVHLDSPGEAVYALDQRPTLPFEDAVTPIDEIVPRFSEVVVHPRDRTALPGRV